MKLAVKEGPVSYVDQHNSGGNFLALRELFSRLPTDKTIDVLDMGPAWNANIQFFSQFRTRLYIEDLYHWMRRKDPASTAKKAKDFLQTYPQDTKFDVILFWDIFEYLEKQQLSELISHLQQYCKKGTLLFFVTSTMDTVPDQPAQFKIIDAEHLSYSTTTTNTRESRHFRQSNIQNLLPGFRLIRAFRMSSGVEENLYIYD